MDHTKMYPHIHFKHITLHTNLRYEYFINQCIYIVLNMIKKEHLSDAEMVEYNLQPFLS